MRPEQVDFSSASDCSDADAAAAAAAAAKRPWSAPVLMPSDEKASSDAVLALVAGAGHMPHRAAAEGMPAPITMDASHLAGWRPHLPA